MELNCKSKIIDDLFEIRGEGLIRNYVKQKGKPKISKKSEKTEEQLIEFMKKFIKDENDMKKLFEKINNFESDVLDEMCFWHKPYYKLGFIDGLNYKKEIRNLKEKLSSRDNADTSNIDTFFNNCLDEFLDYFEREKSRKLAKREDYIELKKKRQQIKEKYPNVTLFIEDEETNKILNTEELRAVLDIIEIEQSINALEVEEAFKLGLKENEML